MKISLILFFSTVLGFLCIMPSKAQGVTLTVVDLAFVHEYPVSITSAVVYPGEELILDFQIINHGVHSQNLSEGYIRINKSNTDVNKQDLKIASFPIRPLDNLEKVHERIGVVIPEKIRPGRYTLWIILDPGGKTTQTQDSYTREWNDRIAVPIMLLGEGQDRAEFAQLNEFMTTANVQPDLVMLEGVSKIVYILSLAIALLLGGVIGHYLKRKQEPGVVANKTRNKKATVYRIS